MPSERTAAEVRRSPRALARDSIDRVVILPDDGGDALVLSGPAALGWRLLAEPLTRRQLVERLAALYGVEPAVVMGDIAEVVDALERRGAVEAVAS